MIKYRLPIIAVTVAVIITTAMDLTGYFLFSALPLIVITIVFWLIQRQSKQEIGLKLSSAKFYGMAILYPAIVLGTATLIAYLSGNFFLKENNWSIHIRNIAIGCTIGIIPTLLTEEGFFRGWLWGAFKRAGLNSTKTLLVTSGCFTIWHISAFIPGTEYGLPMWQVPVFLVNAALLGLIWGLMRSISGSAIVSSVSHAVWNAFAYELFGFGKKLGVLGIKNTILLGPEVGFVGIVLNGAFFLWLWNKQKQSNMK